MGDRLVRKGLVVGIIILFIGIGIQSAIANDVYINIETKHNSDEGRASDDYQEIITYIYGYARINWIKRKGIFCGEVEIEQKWPKSVSLRGLRLSDGGVEKYNITDVDYVYVPHFIGFSTMSPLMYLVVIGLAFGNIEWELIE